MKYTLVTRCWRAVRGAGRLGRCSWQARWNLLRLGISCTLLVLFVGDLPAALTRFQLASLPQYDYKAEVDRLRQEGRYGEALVVADAGLPELDGDELNQLQAARNQIISERDSVLCRIKKFGTGALLGEGRTIEGLAGAITADLFVVGDVRDLLIQFAHAVVDHETDEVVLALSAVGVLTTVLPQIDWLPSIFKLADKVGAMTKNMAKRVTRLCRRALKTKALGPLREFAAHTKTLIKKTGVGGFFRLLRHVDDPKDLEKLARFVKREPAGAFALHVAGRDGVRWVTRTGRDAEQVLVKAARKGDRGVAWLRGGKLRLLRPHPILGLLKSWRKGNLERLAHHVIRKLDSHEWLVIPSLGLWALLEIMLLGRRFRRSVRSAVPAPTTG